MKKKSIVFFLTILSGLMAYAQRHEIGIQLGASNLVGDIGRTQYLHPLPNSIENITSEGIPFYASLLYRLNVNPYQSVRFSAGYSHVQFNDLYAQEQYRRDRRFSGSNSVYEASAIFEYNFFPVNEEQKDLVSPYVFGGVSGMLYGAKQAVLYHDFVRGVSGAALPPTSDDDFTTAVRSTGTKNKFTLGIPFGVGLKYKFNYNWAFFGEFMFRPTFSDGLDYSKMETADVRQTFNRELTSGNVSLLQTEPYLSVANRRAAQYIDDNTFGNPKSKDWVNTVSLGISYSFGRPPCYCD